MKESERIKFFTKNKTSMIDYPKGIPEIGNYLVSMKSDRNPLEMLTADYQELSNKIEEVADYIKKESQSSD